MNALLRNIRYALRQLRKSPGFTAVALITIALCIGANLTIFAAVDAILLRPLPFRHSDRLVILYNTYPRAGKARDGASLTNYYERRGNIPAFSHVASMNYVSSVVGETGSTEAVDIGRVTPEFFSTLGVAPMMGRAFTESEMTYQSDNEAILTYEYWQRHFNGDPNILGRDVRCGDHPRKIVGVLPAGFRFLSSHAQIFMPLSSEEAERNANARHNNNNIEIGRLKPAPRWPKLNRKLTRSTMPLPPEPLTRRKLRKRAFERLSRRSMPIMSRRFVRLFCCYRRAHCFCSSSVASIL